MAGRASSMTLHMPRATRDRLLLLLVVAWICAQHAIHLPLWSTLACGAVLAAATWRVWRARGEDLKVPRTGLLLGLAAATAATLLSYQTLFGKEAGVTFLLLLLCLKTCEVRARRDVFMVFFLGFFAQLCNLLFSQSLLSALAMVAGVLGLLALLVNAHMPAGRPTLRLLLSTSGALVLWGAPIMVTLFLLFPRLPPLWGLPSDTQQGYSGLGRDMEVGSIAALALDSSIALRVRFQDTPPPSKDMYFRGPVLTRFDGRRWTQATSPVLRQPLNALEVSGAPVAYQVTLQANQMPWLLVLDATPEAPEISGFSSALHADLQWTLNRPVTAMVRYQARSYTNFHYSKTLSDAERGEALMLPPGRNPRTLAWARALRQDPANADPQARVLALLLQLRTGGYQYTLTPGLYGDDSADAFWFDRKAGFCEHIASAFVLAMRALQVPARVVTGYQGGERNPIDGVWTVRQSDAHAWAEVWLAGQGWTRVDPTAAVAPERTQARGRLREPPGLLSEALFAVSPGFLDQSRSAWEALNSRWNQWVLNYTDNTQRNLLRQAGFTSPDWQTLVQLLGGSMALLALLGAAWMRWSQSRTDPWLALLNRAAARLRVAGLLDPQALRPGPATPGLLILAVRQRPDLAPLVDWLQRLERWRYAAPAESPFKRRATLAKLGREFHRLRWPTRLPNDVRAP